MRVTIVPAEPDPSPAGTGTTGDDMAGAEFSPLITTRADLIEAMARGSKPKSEWRVGTEHEKHVYRKNPLRPVPYAGDDGIAALLDGIHQRTGWDYFYDKGNA